MAKTRLLLVGAGGYGRSVAEAAELSGQFAVVGFMDDSLAAGDTSLVVPVLGPFFRVYRRSVSLGILQRSGVHRIFMKLISSQEPRAKSQEPRTKSQEPRAKSQEPGARSQEPGASEVFWWLTK